jgi:hypothetical protein
MNEKIFHSKFSLSFIKSEIQLNFFKKSKEAHIKYAFRINLVIFVLSLVTSSINFYFRNESSTLQFSIVKYTSYLNSGMNLIFMLVSRFSKNFSIIKIINYLGYVFLLFTCANFKYPIVVFLYNRTFVPLIIILLIELLCRLIYGVFNIFTFKEYLTLNLIESLLIWTYLYPTWDPVASKFTTFYLICYNFLFCFLSLICYLIDMQSKTVFYYNYMYEEKLAWIHSILDHVKTGILSIEGKKINYMNSLFTNFIENLKQQSHNSTTESKIILI